MLLVSDKHLSRAALARSLGRKHGYCSEVQSTTRSGHVTLQASLLFHTSRQGILSHGLSGKVMHCRSVCTVSLHVWKQRLGFIRTSCQRLIPYKQDLVSTPVCSALQLYLEHSALASMKFTSASDRILCPLSTSSTIL